MPRATNAPATRARRKKVLKKKPAVISAMPLASFATLSTQSTELNSMHTATAARRSRNSANFGLSASMRLAVKKASITAVL